MLIAKGYAVRVLLERGANQVWVAAPASYGLLHDPSGTDWSKCSGLVAPFSKGGGELDDGDAKSYFGHAPREGELALPPKALSRWKRLGVITEIEYTRRRPGNLPADHKAPYYHPFEQGKLPTLYRLGRLLRFEMGPGCVWNWRGIVRP